MGVRRRNSARQHAGFRRPVIQSACLSPLYYRGSCGGTSLGARIIEPVFLQLVPERREVEFASLRGPTFIPAGVFECFAQKVRFKTCDDLIECHIVVDEAAAACLDEEVNGVFLSDFRWQIRQFHLTVDKQRDTLDNISQLPDVARPGILCECAQGIITESNCLVRRELREEIFHEKRNIFRGPGFANVDAGLIKNNRWAERYNVQLRFEFFNLFNRVNLQGVDSDLSSGTFGYSTSTYNPRNIQAGLRIEF